jgi:GTPase
MYDTKEDEERLILFTIDRNNKDEITKDNLEELSLLVKTAGGTTVAYLVQKKENPHTGHYLGKGKVLELKDLIALTNATGVVCDDELSSRQLSNLEELLDIKTMDRTMVILDIFAKHAESTEGKLQVELAQLKYNASHLIGITKNLSRQAGGIGSRGPGEKKLETDRRYIRNKIVELEHELSEIETQRKVQREKREKNGIPIVSMVGYTNAGKSTLMNSIAQTELLAIDKLFATLDTTTRKLCLPNDSYVLFSDTVGFIKKLPHNLIRAFKSTLEELTFSDILIHVVDSSSATREAQMEVVYKTLAELGCKDKPIITVFNKIDKDYLKPLPTDKNATLSLSTSAKEEIGLDIFLTSIENVMKSFRKEIHVIIPYIDGKVLNMIYGSCEIVKEEHRDNGTYLHLFATDEMYNRLEKYTIIKLL